MMGESVKPDGFFKNIISGGKQFAGNLRQSFSDYDTRMEDFDKSGGFFGNLRRSFGGGKGLLGMATGTSGATTTPTNFGPNKQLGGDFTQSGGGGDFTQSGGGWMGAGSGGSVGPGPRSKPGFMQMMSLGMAGNMLGGGQKQAYQYTPLNSGQRARPAWNNFGEGQSSNWGTNNYGGR